MEYKEILQALWKQYHATHPIVRKVYELIATKEKVIVNDHIALRTCNHPSINMDHLAQPFLQSGYVQSGSYDFPRKKLKAHHYEHTTDKDAPKIFISELLMEEFSNDLQNILLGSIEKIPTDILTTPELLWQGCLWKHISYKTYQKLRQESEYAAWWYVYGFCANHFTISLNHLSHFTSLPMLCVFLKEHGIELNETGGIIKGTPEQLLEQASTVAGELFVEFSDGVYDIPGSYYEFAKRYQNKKGELYQGFIAASADKIFESTNFRK
ncbi:MAG: succinyldiaminopimelate aminotransferase [Thiotrichales bacterium]|nr:MAG: succinyldiaminopimelate aminotransferase [Thiotrichales bacterium]